MSQFCCSLLAKVYSDLSRFLVDEKIGEEIDGASYRAETNFQLCFSLPEQQAVDGADVQSAHCHSEDTDSAPYRA